MVSNFVDLYLITLVALWLICVDLYLICGSLLPDRAWRCCNFSDRFSSVQSLWCCTGLVVLSRQYPVYWSVFVVERYVCMNGSKPMCGNVMIDYFSNFRWYGPMGLLYEPHTDWMHLAAHFLSSDHVILLSKIACPYQLQLFCLIFTCITVLTVTIMLSFGDMWPNASKMRHFEGEVKFEILFLSRCGSNKEHFDATRWTM